MHIPDLPRSEMRWDAFEAFHWNLVGNVYCTDTYANPDYVIFDTGEVLVTSAALNSERRGTPSGLGLRTYGANDRNLPTLCHDDVKIPVAWLTEGGQQYFVVDEDLGRAYGVNAITRDCLDHTKLPTRFYTEIKDTAMQVNRRYFRGVAYYPGPGREPVSAGVTLHVPPGNKHFVTDAEREHVAEQQALCRAVLSLEGKEVPLPHLHVPFDVVTSVTSWEELKPTERQALFHGLIGRNRVKVPWLSVR